MRIRERVPSDWCSGDSPASHSLQHPLWAATSATWSFRASWELSCLCTSRPCATVLLQPHSCPLGRAQKGCGGPAAPPTGLWSQTLEEGVPGKERLSLRIPERH